jgi:hypothetical protein
MITKQLSAILVCLFFFTAAVPFASAQTAADVAKVKAQVIKRSTGDKKKVKVKSQLGYTMKGYISRVGDDSFDLTDSKGKVTVFPYREVESVKRGGLSTATIATLAGLAAGGIVVAVILGQLYGDH